MWPTRPVMWNSGATPSTTSSAPSPTSAGRSAGEDHVAVACSSRPWAARSSRTCRSEGGVVRLELDRRRAGPGPVQQAGEVDGARRRDPLRVRGRPGSSSRVWYSSSEVVSTVFTPVRETTPAATSRYRLSRQTSTRAPESCSSNSSSRSRFIGLMFTAMPPAFHVPTGR